MTYLHEKDHWTKFQWNKQDVDPLVEHVQQKLCELYKKARRLPPEDCKDLELEMLTNEIVHSSKIDGQQLNTNTVRSHVAKKLKLSNIILTNQQVSELVELNWDSIQHQNLSKHRIFKWHRHIFSGPCEQIAVGQYRDGNMSVVSGSEGREKVHFIAPSAARLDSEMENLFQWTNSEQVIDLVLKSAILHFWFVTLHPMEDGNGRIARALSNMILMTKSPLFLYSISKHIAENKKSYYLVLEDVGKEFRDFASWLMWYLKPILETVEESVEKIGRVNTTMLFWQTFYFTNINSRQRK